MPPVFHRHFLGVLHLSLLFALDTIGFSHFQFLSSLQLITVFFAHEKPPYHGSVLYSYTRVLITKEIHLAT
jgi:hypothetical protein